MKKTLSVIISLAMLISAFASVDISARANETKDGWVYTVLSDGTAEITGYNQITSKLYIPSKVDGKTVTSIGAQAFKDTKYKYVSISDTVTNISKYAFEGCNNLRNVDFGKSVKTIGKCAFCNDCLAEAILPDTVETIESDAFNINLGGAGFRVNDAKKIGCYKRVYLGKSLKKIGSNAFSFSEATVLHLPDSLETIESNAFEGFEYVTSFKLPKTVKSIGVRAFEFLAEKSGLNELTVDFDLKDMKSGIFESSGIKSLVLTNKVTELPASTFYNCESLSKVKFSDNLKKIGKYAFENCSSLKRVKLPASLEEIELFAFAKCYSLKWAMFQGSSLEKIYSVFSETDLNTLIVPKSVKYLDLDGAYDLKDLYYEGSFEEWDCMVIENAEGLDNTNIHYNHKHEYKNYLTKATLTSDGRIVHKCICDDILNTTVIPRVDSVKLSQKEYVYSGNSCKPTVTVKDRTGKQLNKNSYTVTYAKGRKNVGVYNVKVSFKGNYSGTKTLSFTVKPKSTKLTKLKKAKQSFKAKWKKRKVQVSGYQIQYSTSPKFKNSKKVIIKGYGTTNTKIKNLKAKKKYYVRIRTYKTVNGKRIFSAYSKVKTVKTK